MKTRKKSFKIPIYFGKLKVVQTKDFPKWVSKLANVPEDKSHEVDSVVCQYLTKQGVSRYAVIFRAEHCNHSIIAHETAHIVNKIFNDRGVALDINNDEPQAYLTGWVAKKIYSAVKVTK